MLSLQLKKILFDTNPVQLVGLGVDTWDEATTCLPEAST